MQQIAWFLGATAADVAVNDVPFSLQTVMSLNGPLGVTLGSFVGLLVGGEVAKGVIVTDPEKGLAVVLACMAAGGILLVTSSGGTWQSAVAMSVAGGALAYLIAPPAQQK